MNEIDWYYATDQVSLRFYKLYHELFKDEYLEKLSLAAKNLYCFLVNRVSLSVKNGFIDNEKRVYVIFTRAEAAKLLSLTERSVIKVFKELETMNLIYEEKRGKGLSNLIYVGKLKVENKETDRSEKISCNITQNSNEWVKKFHTTKTDITNKDKIKTNLSEKVDDFLDIKTIKSRAKLDEFSEDKKEILGNILEKLYNAKNFKVGNEIISNEIILKKLEKITKENLLEVLEVVYNKKNLKNTMRYLMVVLFNSLDNNVKKIKRFEGRVYTDKEFEEFYDT